MRKPIWLVTLIACVVLSACAPAVAPGPGAAPSGAEAGSGASAPGSGSSGAQAGVLTAGDFDDNLNPAAFGRYLAAMQTAAAGQTLPRVQLDDRVTLRVLDAGGRGVPNARVQIFAGGTDRPALEGSAGADGQFQFFPAFDGVDGATPVTVRVRPPDADAPLTALTLTPGELGEARQLEVRLETWTAAAPSALDLMLVIDTTGSMGDEMSYLAAEFINIAAAVRAQFPGVAARFGLVVYRDQGDAYVVRSYGFTESAEVMQQQLAQQAAGGGGDYPEAMDRALAAALEAPWRGGNTARLLFLVADAPPHDEHLSDLLAGARLARRAGVHVYPLAASGVADTAEYLMRITAAATHGRYLFLTDDSGVGNAHAEPRVPCYRVTRLDQLMIRVIAGELSGGRVEASPEEILRSVGQQEGGVCVGS